MSFALYCVVFSPAARYFVRIDPQMRCRPAVFLNAVVPVR